MSNGNPPAKRDANLLVLRNFFLGRFAKMRPDVARPMGKGDFKRMITGIKNYTRARVIRFLGINQEIETLRTRLSALEESHYAAIGELRPPHDMVFVGEGDFKKVGEKFLGYFQEFCDLRPDERVLDVGCGIGRLAIPLTKYLDENGSYEGFDIVRQGIDWCKRNIKPRFPHFNFQWVDVYNKRYNPEGKIAAKDLIFPYQDQSFDFVFAISVFTHMLREDMQHYLSEVSRVMKSNASCFVTYHLLNQEALECIRQGKSRSNFQYRLGENSRTNNKATPEAGVAYDEKFICSLYEKHQLNITKIYLGSWCGRDDYLNFPSSENVRIRNFQDIVIASKL